MSYTNETGAGKYTTPATSDQPAFIIYLVDTSDSMKLDCGGRRRIDIVSEALERTRRTMIARSRRGDQVRPRYAVAMVGYSDTAVDLLGGIKTINELEEMTLPALNPHGRTNTAAAFQAAESLLRQYLPNLQDCPAPLVCHLTDGENNGAAFKDICDRIKGLGTSDGTVLIENIFIGAQLLERPIADIYSWQGVTSAAEIKQPFVQDLWHVSSPLPQSYAAMMSENEGYGMAAGARMLIPAETPKMIELAFTMSGSTPIREA